jgi:CysZ protein
LLAAFSKAFAQLSDPRILRVVVRSVLASVVLYVLMIAGLVWLLNTAWVKGLPLIGTLLAWGAGFAALIVATLLFPGVISGLSGLWLDDVAAAVEARHYPHLPAPRKTPLTEALSMSARLTVRTVAINIVLLPLYLVLLFVPPLNLVIYYGVNGRLLGREYFETVALRRLSPPEIDALRRARGGSIWAGGAITAFLLTVPFLNLLAPVIGTAAMVHIFQKLTSKP